MHLSTPGRLSSRLTLHPLLLRLQAYSRPWEVHAVRPLCEQRVFRGAKLGQREQPQSFGKRRTQTERVGNGMELGSNLNKPPTSKFQALSYPNIKSVLTNAFAQPKNPFLLTESKVAPTSLSFGSKDSLLPPTNPFNKSSQSGASVFPNISQPTYPYISGSQPQAPPNKDTHLSSGFLNNQQISAFPNKNPQSYLSPSFLPGNQPLPTSVFQIQPQSAPFSTNLHPTSTLTINQSPTNFMVAPPNISQPALSSATTMPISNFNQNRPNSQQKLQSNTGAQQIQTPLGQTIPPSCFIPQSEGKSSMLSQWRMTQNSDRANRFLASDRQFQQFKKIFYQEVVQSYSSSSSSQKRLRPRRQLTRTSTRHSQSRCILYYKPSLPEPLPKRKFEYEFHVDTPLGSYCSLLQIGNQQSEQQIKLKVFGYLKSIDYNVHYTNDIEFVSCHLDKVFCRLVTLPEDHSLDLSLSDQHFDLKCMPARDVLLREGMQAQQLTIYNQFGSIQFKGPLKLTNLNFEQYISLEKHFFQIYPEGTVRPRRGCQLNRSALVTLFFKDRPQKFWRFENKFREAIRKQGGELMKFDVANLSWSFTISPQ